MEMSSAKRKPWMKFYPADWQADDGLRQCSLTARGLWIEMIAIMHKSEEYGCLTISGIIPSADELAHRVQAPLKIVEKALIELERWGVFSRLGNGMITSRRMIRDAEKAERDAANGKGGGNPKLLSADNGGVNPPDKPPNNGGDKAQRLEARG